MIALLVGAGVFLFLVGLRKPSVSSMVGRYVEAIPTIKPQRGAGSEEIILWGGVGSVAGAVLLPMSWGIGAVVGAVAGIFIESRLKHRARDRRRKRLGYELPAIADLLALYVLSGESVLGAMRRVHADASGIAAHEIGVALDAIDSGCGLPEAARRAAAGSAHPDGARLYEILAQAHRSGSRLVDALEIFSSDRRSSIAGEMTAEGGRRALIGYGPILGLMIPTTLAFLIYPTLAGLDALAASQP